MSRKAMLLLHFYSTTFCTPVAANVVFFFYSRVVQIHCFSIVCPSFIDVCIVLFCFALLHPSFSVFRWPACIWGLVFSAVPVPPPPGVNIEEHIQIRQEEKRQRINRRHRLEEGRGMHQGDGGYIYGLYRFCFMNLEEMNDTDWVKMTKQDLRLNILCPFHFFFQALKTFRCCLSLGAAPWVLLPCLCL